MFIFPSLARSKYFLLAALCIAFVSAVAVRGQGGPPMITDDTGTTPPGHWEINTALTMERTADGRSFEAPLADINYGLTEHTQLKLEIPWVVLHNNGQRAEHGLGNTNIGLRWRFRDETEHHRLALSVYPQFEFNNPTSSVRLGLVDKGPEFLMPLQWQTQIGKFGINGDAGYRFKRGRDELTGGVVVGRQITGSLELLAEIHGTGPRQNLSESETVYNLGTRLKLTPHATLLLSAGKSIKRNADPRFIGYGGVQITF
jgi:hypothetical protein